MKSKLPRIDWHLSAFRVPYVPERDKMVEMEITHQSCLKTVGFTDDFEPIEREATWTNLDIIFYSRRLYISIQGKWFKERKFAPLPVALAK